MSFTISRSIFGTIDGETQPVYKYVITNTDGMCFTSVSYGATIISIKTPDRHGNLSEITLCRDNLPDLQTKSRYFGAIAGRYANRIRHGKFTLDGVEYQLPINNGVNSLHGGIRGFDKRVWTSTVFMDEQSAGVRYTYRSADGEEGYPGELTATVTYRLTSSSDLHVSYYAVTTKPTIVNLTNHTYFNLSGDCQRKITEHRLHLSCSSYLPVDDTQIPLGEIRPCAGTAFDFTTAEGGGCELKDRIPEINGGGEPGIDHTFVLDAQEDTSGMRHIATLTDPVSGRQLILHGTQPGVQVYTSNFLTKDAEAFPFIQHNAICLETQNFPNAINEPSFPDAVLRPGEIYHHEAIFSFRVAA